MPCDSYYQKDQTPAQRKEQVKKTLTRLEAALLAGSVKVKIGANGAVALDGWKPDDRAGVTDVCAIRTLTSQNSWAYRQAVAKAESQTGRKVSTAAVAAGIHSHDGGRTFHPGHKK